MNNIAIWYEAAAGHTSNLNDNAVLQLHINFWKLPKNKQKEFFIDLGFMISGLSKTQNLKIYLPIKGLQKTSIADLGGLLQRNAEVLDNVFNEHFGAGKELIPFQKTILHPSGEDFTLFEINLEKHLDFVPEENGTIIRINVSQYAKPAKDKGYFRFRVNRGSDIFVKASKNEKLQFQSTKAINETIDIRINEKRNLPSGVSELIEKAKQFKIFKINCLFMRDTIDECHTYSYESTSRSLEPVWSEYVGHDYDISRIIAHHMKSIEPESANFLAKFQYTESSLSTNG